MAAVDLLQGLLLELLWDHNAFSTQENPLSTVISPAWVKIVEGRMASVVDKWAIPRGMR